MLDRIRSWFQEAPPGDIEFADRIRWATAALLVEMTRADFEQTSDEDRAVAELLAGHFSLNEDESEELLAEAQKTVEGAVSLHDFTRTLHDTLDEPEKIEVVRMLWHVAFADGELDRYEDYLVRKLANLLYVSPGDVIRVRNEVIKAAETQSV